MTFLRRRFAAIAVCLTALHLLGAGFASAHSISVTQPAVVGGLLELAFAVPAHIDAVEVELRSDEGRIARTWAFTRPDWTEWVALIGIPSWSRPGDYEVAAYFYDVQNSIIGRDLGSAHVTRRRAEVEVRSREFRRERIALNTEMSAVRRDDSERRRRESRELAALLRSTNTSSIYALRPLQMPISVERRTSEFGDRRTFVYSDGNEGGAIHHGIDFGAPTGTVVVAPGAGRVVMAKSRVITGNTIVIEHLPGVFSLYYHLDRIDVAVGTMVRTGTPIGTVGSTGLSTGPHLHWELRVSAVPVDPEPFLSRPILDFRGDSGKIDNY